MAIVASPPGVDRPEDQSSGGALRALRPLFVTCRTALSEKCEPHTRSVIPRHFAEAAISAMRVLMVALCEVVAHEGRERSDTF